MPIRVNVIGQGVVEFPDGMTDAEMEEALKKLPSDETKEEPTSATGAFLREAATGVAPGAAAASAFGPSAAVGVPFSELAGPAAPLVPLATGLIGSAGAGLAAEYAQSKLLQRFFPGFLKKEEQGRQEHPLAAAAGRVASAAPSFELSPGAILRSPKALAAQLGAQLGISAAQTGLEQHRLPTAPELLESASVAALYGHPRFSLPIPASLQKGVQAYARSQQKAATVHGDVRAFPGESPREVPVAQGGGGVQPQPEEKAKGLGEEAPLSLDPGIPHITGSDQGGWTLRFLGREEPGFATREEAEQAANQVIGGLREMPKPELVELSPEDEDFADRMEREAIDQGEQLGVKFEVKEKQPEPEDPTVPFAKGAYFQALGGNRAALYRDKFREWVTQDLRGLSESRINKIIYSKVSQELEHNHVMRTATNDEVSQYGRNLTPLERDIEERIYGKRFGEDYLNLGHEAFARRLQQAMGMTRGMFAELALKENLQLRSLDLMARIVRRAREAVGEKRAAANRELYDRVLDNIDYAKAVLSATQGPDVFSPSQVRLLGEKITAAAVVTPNGTVETGANHPEILERLGIKGFEKPESRNTADFGFQTTHRSFITREEAGPLATASGQNLKEFEPGEPVHSDEVAAPGTSTPISETGPGLGPAARRRQPGELEEEFYAGRVARLQQQVDLSDLRQDAEGVRIWSKRRDEAQRKLDEIRKRGAGPEAFPAASRRDREKERERAREQGQSEMFGPQVKGLGSQIPQTAPEQRVVESTALPPVTPLEQGAAYIFSGFSPPLEARGPEIGPRVGEPTEPTFQNFASWARRNISEKLENGPLFDVWLDAVNKSIESAPGSKLNEMVEKLDLKSRVYPWRRVPGGREYTRVEIPDFQQIPRDPLTLGETLFPGMGDRIREMIGDERLKELKAEREGIIKRQKLRSKALSAIYQRVIEEGMPTITDLTPKDVTAEDIAFDNPNTSFGAYRTISPEERANPEKLRQIFTDEARAKDQPVSHTKRLAVMLNQRSGEVALVSAYPHGRSGIVVVEPSGATGKRGKPNVPLRSAQNRGWEPIIAVLRKEPVKDFYKGFKDIADYNRYLGTDASEIGRTSTAAPEPEEISDMPPSTRWQDAPLSTKEALDLHNWLNDPEEWSGTTGVRPEVERATTKPDMREAMQRLVDLGENNKLKPRQWNAIVALRKMALEQYRRDRNEFANIMRNLRTSLRGATPEARRAQIERASQGGPTPEGSMVTALDRLYEYNQASESQAEYLSHVMGEFARPTAEPKGAQPIQGAAAKETGRELTMLERRPPTATNWQGPPVPNMGPPTEPSPPQILPPESQEFVRKEAARRFPYKPTEEGPAASIREIRERGKRRIEEVADYAAKWTTVPIRRATTEHDILAAADGADRQLEGYDNTQPNEIRITSVKPTDVPKKQSLWTRFLGGVFFTPEARRVRESIPAYYAAQQAAEREEWHRVIRENDKLRQEYGSVSKAPEHLHPVFKRPTVEDLRADHFDPVIERANQGIEKARQSMESNSVRTRMVGRRWLKAAQKLKDRAVWAKEHFKDPEVKATAASARAVFDQHLENMNAYGIKVSGRDYYVPGALDGEYWNDHGITWNDLRILGTNFRLPKTFDNYYHAIASGPYMPVNLDIADLAQHSLAAGGRIMAKQTWFNALKDRIDPVSRKPIAIEPEWSKWSLTGFKKPKEMSQEAFEALIEQLRKDVIGKPNVPPEIANELLTRAGIGGPPGGWKVPKGREDYELVYPTENSKPLAIRKGYKDLVKSAMAQSSIGSIPGALPALRASQMLKHGLILIIDSFHPARLAQYSFALAGKNPWGTEAPSFLKRQHYGLHALMYNPESLDEAVKIGAISQKSADWARTPVTIYDNDKPIHMTRQELLRFGLRRGLNATQTSDTLYRNSIQRIPFIGERWNQLLSPMNKWIFDRITPGVISESFVANMERMNAKNPHLSLDKQVREVVRDMNVFYGNLGRNGIFRHPTARDLAQIVLLAPLWQEGLIGKELRTLSRLTGVSYALGRRGLGAGTYFGPLTRGIVRGLGAYFVLTQMINLASRGKWTFQNPEEDHKLDAWIPVGGEKGIWLSPMSVFGEVTHDLVRLAESKPKTWDAITQFGRNKLGPIGRLGWILAEDKSPTGEQITTTGGVLGRAASELAPAPISLGTYAKAVAPGVFGPVRREQVAQRGLSAFGIKTQLPTRAETDIRRLADKFVKDNNLAFEPLAFTPTDTASYAKLRGALRNGDESGASRILQELRKHRSDEQILKSMRLSSERPFAGSKANEIQFLYSLSNQQLDQYYRANMDRATEFQNFLSWYVRQPSR